MGLLKGLYQYEQDSASEFKDWATDVPAESFGSILDEWSERNSSKNDKTEMKDYICDECPNWSKWAIKAI
jgi:hypothetical protein